MIRVVVVLVVVLALSIAGNVYLYKHLSNTDKESIENPYQGARKADDVAAQIMDKAREEAAQKAQEKRDALKNADTIDSIDDLLERCRRGLFGKSGNKDCNFDAAKGGNGTMSESKNP